MVRCLTIVAALATLMSRGEVPQDVYLLIGQSNMAGRGKMADAPRIATDRVCKFGTNGTWEVSLPGFSDVLLRTKAPSVYLDRRFAAVTADPSAPNLAAGVKYGTWQDEKRAQGLFYKEGAARVIESSGNGCYTVPIVHATPGETYAVEVPARGNAATPSATAANAIRFFSFISLLLVVILKSPSSARSAPPRS